MCTLASELNEASAQVGASTQRQAARVQAWERTKAGGLRGGGGLSPRPRGDARLSQLQGHRIRIERL